MDGGGSLAALAARAGHAAVDVRLQVAVMRSAGAVSWRGAAAQGFAARLEEACARAARLAGVLDDLDDAVRAHAARAAARAEALAVGAAVGADPWR